MTQNVALHMQLHLPTGVTHTASAFLSAPAPSSSSAPSASAPAAALPDLVVVRSTLLEVYAPRRGYGGSLKLELLAQQRLFGVVESLAVLRGRAGRSGRDALLLAFRDAKLAVLQWDPAGADLAPSSLHYFEGDESLKGGREAFARPPAVAADPAGRCAAVVMLRHQLAVLPATESESAALGVAGDDPFAPGADFTAAGEGAAAAVGNSYVDNLSKAGIREVRDAVFLHGCAEPTLLVLHEGDPSWAGALRTRRDTAALTALSLNLSARRHPRIWGVQGVPTDAYRLVAAPCGGALVLTATGILHYSQGSQTGVVLHSAALPARQPLPPLAFDLAKETPGAAAARWAREHAAQLPPAAASATLAFCDAAPAGWDLECDGARAAWISRTTALVGLKSGQLLLVEVARRGGGAPALRVAKAGVAPPAAAMTALSPSTVFIGSCAGDSLLLGCALGRGAAAGGGGGAEGRDAKRRRLESAEADHAGTADPEGGEAEEGEEGGEDDDEELLYGADADGAGPAAAGAAADLKVSLSVLDSFIGIGPVHSLASSASGAAGGEAPYLLAACGAGRGGALAVLRRSVAPDIVTEVPLPEVRGAWAVGVGGGAPDGAKPFDSYLILGFPAVTKVFSTGEELRDVTDEVEFAADAPTLAAAAVAGGRRALQAFPQGLRLLEGGEQRQDVWAGDLAGGGGDRTGVKIVSVAVRDPFVVARLSDGTAAVLRVDPRSGELGVLGALAGPPGARATAACLFEDECGWVRERCLGGAAGEAQVLGEGEEPEEPVFLCLAAFSDGSAAIWQLPEVGGDPLWRCGGAGDGAAVLAAGGGPGGRDPSSPGAEVVEVRLESFPSPAAARPDLAKASPAPAAAAPLLVALTADHCLLAYRAFAVGAEPGLAASLRFKRLVLDAPPVVPPAEEGPAARPAQRLFRFDAVGEQIPHSGVFVAGAAPQWLVASRGALAAHPHASGALAGFTPFHNVNSPHAFITVAGGGAGRIAVAGLPPRQRLDAPWPRQKVAIKAAPHAVCLYPEAQLWAVATSRAVPYAPLLPEEDGGEPQASYSYALADAAAKARGSQPLHEVRLVAPGSWATVWRGALAPGEAALAVAAVHLRDATTGATVPLLAVGAGMAAGEDYPAGGRVLLFEVRRGEGGRGWAAEMVYAREFKGPVTGVATMEGHLLISTGHRLETCTLSSTTVAGEAGTEGARTTYKLTRSAFYDGPCLVTSLCVVKSFALVGDAAHSVQFVRYREEGRQLALLGKDFGRAGVRAAQFLIAGSALHIVAADAAGSLRAFTYAPAEAGAWKGQKLVAWGALHVGDGPGAMARLRMPQIDPGDATVRQAVAYGTDAGALGAVMPLAAGDHLAGGHAGLGDALRALQAELVMGAPAAAGLNAGAFRRRHAKVPPALEGAAPYGPPLPLGAQGLLDGDLLLRFAGLPRGAQARLAGRAGLTRGQVLAVLSALVRGACLV